MDMTSFTRRHLILAGTAATLSAPLPALAAGGAPKAYGATPSPRQYRWHNRTAYAFVHFTINTFTDREWGYGDESVDLFNPTDFSADQIVEAAKAGGLTGLILTAKHHDGFCLWPSAYTEHSVKNSPYKNGKGDIVGEMAQACKRHGLAFGVYLSPWDRNHAEYGRPAYVEYYHNQLRELTTQYGKLFEVWFDGANGGDGYYGGAREARRINGATYYEWDKVRAIVRKNQPDAVMFADADMDVRWVGNEEGHAGDPCWPTVDATPYTQEKGNKGVRGGAIWNPAETNVSIRPGWFWHADEQPRTPANLTKVYFESIGRGTTLLLNLAPDRRGRVPDADVASLKAWKAIIDKTFARNLATGGTVTASTAFGNGYAAANILKPGKFWAAKDDDRTGAWAEIALPAVHTFDVIRFSEDIRLGVRVDDYAVDVLDTKGWREVARHTSIGHERLIRLSAPVTASKVRLRILTAAASPVIGNFGLFLMPPVLEEPIVHRDAKGMVTLTPTAAGQGLFYTIDGGEPVASATAYQTPFGLTRGGVVKAIARDERTGVTSAATTVEFDVSPANWTVVKSNIDTPDALLKGETFFGPDGQPIEAIIDLGETLDIKGFVLAPPVQNISLGIDRVNRMGPPAGYEVWVSADGAQWGDMSAHGEFSNIAANRTGQRIRFASPKTGRYVRIRLPHAVQDKPVIAVGKIGIITR